MSIQDLLIEVIEIKGRCPTYQKGFKFWIRKGFELFSERPLCMHSLLSIAPYYVALSRGISANELGLSSEGSTAYVHCLDPCELTGGGTVILGMTQMDPKDSDWVTEKG